MVYDITAQQQRRIQGMDQFRRSLADRPVSGNGPRLPRAVPGTRWVGNAPLDARRLLAFGTCALVMGGIAASTAAETGARAAPTRPGSMPPANTGHALDRVRNRIPGRDAAGTCGSARSENIVPGPSGGEGGAGTLRSFTLSPRDSGTVAAPAGEPGDGGVLQLAGRWLAALYADPCEDLDTAVNGFWKLLNPPRGSIPSRLLELDDATEDALLRRLQRLPSQASPTPAARLLGDTWSSALRPQSRSWQAFRPHAEAIAALTIRSDVEAYLCAAVGEGREAILAFRSMYWMAELDADAALLPVDERAVYTGTQNDPAVIEYLEQVQTLLVNAGMSAVEAAAHAPAMRQMGARLAASADRLTKVSLASAQAAVTAFPWQRVWTSLGVDPAQELYVGLERCRALAGMLQDHDVADWKAWLLYQEARHARPFIEYDAAPQALLRQLDHDNVGGTLLSEWFVENASHGLAQRADGMFEDIRRQYLQDVVSSAYPPADLQRIAAVLAATRLSVKQNARGIAMPDVLAPATYLQHVHALRRIGLGLKVRDLAAPSTTNAFPLPAHRFFMATHPGFNTVFVSPATLDVLHDASAGQVEAEWAMLGVMLGHELGHALASAAPLSAAGQVIRNNGTAKIAQRLAGTRIAGLPLDIARVLEEVACDLRGVSAAHRAAKAEARAAGTTFDDRRFFEAIARLHAANPTPAQLKRSLANDEHPPSQVRVGLLAQAAGFDAAFGCVPGPLPAFDKIV